MRKFILLISFQLFSLLIVAQSFSLSYLQGPIANNENVYVSSSSNIELEAFVYVTNNTAVTKTVECRKTELSCVPGSVNYFCWGACYTPSTLNGTVHVPIEAGTTNTLNFSGHYSCEGFGGTSLIRYTFYDASHPLDTVCFNVNYTGCSVGINENSLFGMPARLYPNPADEFVCFSYSATDFGQYFAEVRSSSGILINKIQLTPGIPETRINTSGFSPGIYELTLFHNETILSSRKFLVLR